mgnify:FL=1
MLTGIACGVKEISLLAINISRMRKRKIFDLIGFGKRAVATRNCWLECCQIFSPTKSEQYLSVHRHQCDRKAWFSCSLWFGLIGTPRPDTAQFFYGWEGMELYYQVDSFVWCWFWSMIWLLQSYKLRNIIGVRRDNSDLCYDNITMRYYVTRIKCLPVSARCYCLRLLSVQIPVQWINTQNIPPCITAHWQKGIILMLA